MIINDNKCNKAVADPDLQISKGGGHPHPEIKGGSLKKNSFSALRASFWSKNKGGPAPPGSLPWIRHCKETWSILWICSPQFTALVNNSNLEADLQGPMINLKGWSKEGSKVLWLIRYDLCRRLTGNTGCCWTPNCSRLQESNVKRCPETSAKNARSIGLFSRPP